MSRIRIAHLLDDFGLGGVTKGLALFESAELAAHVDSTVIPVDRTALRAPELGVELILIHFPMNWRRLLFVADLRRRNPRARVVLVEHSYTPAWEALKVPVPGRFRAMLRLSALLLDHVVCVSRAQADWLAGIMALASDRITVIHPHSSPPELRAVAPVALGARPLRIGAYGRFSEQKGFDVLIAAFVRGWFGDCELLLGGFGPDEAQLRALAAGCEAVHFFGKVTDLPGFISQCDVIALPSRWEAYGQVANEAREAGRPILVAPVDGLVEQVGDAGLVLDFADRDSIAAALARLTPQAIAAMGAAGREATRDCGHVRRMQWVDLVSRLAGRTDQAIAA